jgi:putative flippase GtrA
MGKKIWVIFENLLRFVICKVAGRSFTEEKWNSTLQFVKFGLVGVLNNIICYITYLLLLYLGVHYSLANIVGFSVSVLNSYYWNNKYVFISEGKRVWWKTFTKTYISYAGTGIILNNVLLYIWIDIFGISSLIAPLINLVIVIPINFIVNKKWAYKKGT